jgi:nitric oxide reductase NorE protein
MADEHRLLTAGAATASAASRIDAQPGRRLMGDPDVWIFIVAELLMFGAFFLAYIVNRAHQVALFNASQSTLDRRLGVLNTLMLISSSWAVAVAVGTARRNRSAAVPRWLALAIGLALGFVVVKYFEYSAKLVAGLSLTTNDFYMFYFCLTGIHLLHVFAGTVILVVVWSNARSRAYAPGRMKGLETAASYWHMVDLLWIVLFTLLYLLR